MLGRAHLEHATAEARPELEGAPQFLGAGTGCGSDRTNAAVEEIGAGVAHASALRAGDGMGADEDRCQSRQTLHGLHNLSLRAPDIRDQYIRGGGFGRESCDPSATRFTGVQTTTT